MNLKKILGIKEVKPICIWKPIHNYYKNKNDMNNFYCRPVCEGCTGEDLKRDCFYNPNIVKGGIKNNG
jgi:hypothetical protein